jgi:serine/threonine protein kinase
MQTLEGTQLGNYDVIRRIRVGGMGAVYEGRQRTAFGRQVAIKVILGDYADDRDMRRRFAREARTIAQLHHPHILPLIEFGEQDGLLYLVMPFIEGGTLTSFLRQELPDLQDIATIFLQLLDAVEYAHEKGLIHRDIKSSNVLLDARRGGKPYVYLADFGLVRTLRAAQSDEVGQPIPLDQVPGTPHYMAPEQTRGIVTQSTDIYALGVLLYQMLTGELPYDDPDDVAVVKMHLYSPIPSPCERDASIPIELGEVAQTAMAKRPEQRFASVAQMRQAFQEAIEEPASHITEDDPEIDVLTPRIMDIQTPHPGPRRQRPPGPLPLPISPRYHQSLRQSRVMRPPRNPSIPLYRAELPQDTVVHIPEQIAIRHRRAVVSPPSRSTHRRAAKGGRKRGHPALLVPVVLLIPVALIILLVFLRVFGVYLFPANVPLVGAPDATVSVTVKSQTISNSYLLMASSGVPQPDVTTRALPDRLLSVVVSGSRVEPASGSQTIPGKQASGILLFDNSSHQYVMEQQGMQFTASNGVVVAIMQDVAIPPRSNGDDGTATAPAVAAEQGVNGNITADALYTTCCNGLIISNPQPFSGGVNESVVHIVAQADLDNASKTLSAGLQRNALQQLQGQLATDEVEAGKPAVSVQITSDKPVGTQTDTVNVQVHLTAKVVAYNAESARQIAEELIIRQAAQQLGNDYQLKDTLIVASPVVTSQESSGVIYLSVAAQGLWLYHLTQQQIDQWRQSIKGATLPLAQTYISTQAGVASVKIQLPFGMDHLPTSLDQILIVLVNE